MKGSTTLSRFNYHLRADGRRDQLNETIAQPDGTSVTRAIQYSFDDANRLTAESGTDGSGKSYSKTYTLDEAGNRQKLVATLDASTTTTNYSYNDLDWMTQQSVVAPSSTTTTNYAYDANGSQTGITAQVGAAAPTYTKQVWDFEGHLTARGATDVNGSWGSSRNQYSYDAAGMRLSQSTVAQSGTTSAKTSYLWNGDRLLEERDKDGVLAARYEHGQELGPLSMLRPATSTIASQTRYFIGDGQDSTRQLMDESGVVKDSYFYDSFGVDLNGGQQTSTNSFKYTGQQQDASGLYYLRARYYEAGSGRFLSHDPEMGSSDDPVSMHRYLYAGADPVNGVDPSGRETMSNVMVTVAINTTLGATFGGVVGAGMAGGDAYFSNPNATPSEIVQAEIQGAISGAKFGALGGALAPIRLAQVGMMLWGAYQAGRGTGAALADGNYALAAWRAGTFLALLGAAKLAHDNPTPGNIRNAKIAENQAELSNAEQFAENPDVAEPPSPRGIQCFVKGTLVTMADGSHKPIEKIEVGDQVVSRDEKSGVTATKKVLRLSSHQAPATLVLHFKDGTRVETTKGHPFYIEGRGFVPAGELGIGTSIVTRAGPAAQLVRIEQKNSAATVYNFEVEDFHTYFVSSKDLWVHNRCAEDIAADALRLDEAATPNAHYFGRHGAGTTLAEQYQRAISGDLPEGGTGNPYNSTRFLSNMDQLAAKLTAEALYRARGGGQAPVEFEMPNAIGEGFRKYGGSDSYVGEIKTVKAYFNNTGKLITVFPNIK